MQTLAIAICALLFLGCSSTGQRSRGDRDDAGSGDAGSDDGADASITNGGEDLGVVPTDGGGGDQASALQLVGGIELRQTGVSSAYFAWLGKGASASSLNPYFTCKAITDCEVCWTDPFPVPDLAPADLWRAEDLTPPPADLLPPHDLAQPPDLLQADLQMVAPNAGAIAISGTTPAFQLSLYGGTGYYVPRTTLDTPLWTDPVTIHIEAPGGFLVPAFETDIEAPAASSVTSAPAIIDRTQPYTVTWPKADGVFQVTVSTKYPIGYALANLSCTFDRSKGQATIPTALLEKLYATADNYTTAVAFGAGTTTQITAGPAKITINATVPLAAPAGQTTFEVQ